MEMNEGKGMKRNLFGRLSRGRRMAVMCLSFLLLLVFGAGVGIFAYRQSRVSAATDAPLSRYLTFEWVDSIDGVGALSEGGYVITGFVCHDDAKDENNWFGTANKPAVIPAQFKGYPVVGIEAGVFSGVQMIKYLTFSTITADGGGVTAYEGESKDDRALAYSRMPAECQTFGTAIRSIGAYCFSASGIVGINLPASLAEIGDGAFINCTALSTIQSFNSLADGSSTDVPKGSPIFKTISLR